MSGRVSKFWVCSGVRVLNWSFYLFVHFTKLEIVCSLFEEFILILSWNVIDIFTSKYYCKNENRKTTCPPVYVHIKFWEKYFYFISYKSHQLYCCGISSWRKIEKLLKAYYNYIPIYIYIFWFLSDFSTKKIFYTGIYFLGMWSLLN